MVDVLLPGVMLVGIATLIVAVGALRSSLRSEGLGEDRYELLRDQHDRLEILREERQVLVEELKRESRERQRLMKTLEEARPRLVEDLERARRENGEAERRAEQQEQEGTRLQHELKRLEEELERERRGHSEVQQRAEQQEQERLRLEGELERSEAQVEDANNLSRKPLRTRRGPSASGRAWWRRTILVVVTFLGILAVWLTSLVIALNLLST